VVLGDPQTGENRLREGVSNDVTVSIIAADPAVMDRRGLGWKEVLRPGAGAPVWPMDAFRDRFLTRVRPHAALLFPRRINERVKSRSLHPRAAVIYPWGTRPVLRGEVTWGEHGSKVLGWWRGRSAGPHQEPRC